MARSTFTIPALLLCNFMLLACENDERVKRETLSPAPAVAPASRSPGVKSAAATPQPGACGMQAEEQPAGACGQAAAAHGEGARGCGCGSNCGPAEAPKAEAPKAEAPAGCNCGSHDTGSAERPIVPITEAKLGDRTRCPVTNSVFVVNTDSPKVELGGKTYHFCCEGCVTRFKKDPQQFLET